jgi:hypothetical protein
MKNERPLEQQQNSDKMPIDIPSAQMPQNPVLSAACNGFTNEMMMETERLQADCHYVVATVIEASKKCTVQDATNVWLFKKLAEFEIRLRKVEEANKVRDMVFGCR